MKRILFYSVASKTAGDLLAHWDACKDMECSRSDNVTTVHTGTQEVQWIHASRSNEAMRCLTDSYINLLILDLRFDKDSPDRVAKGLELLAQLDHPNDVERRYGFHRILVLVSGPNFDEIDALIVRLGGLGVQNVLQQRPYNKPSPKFSRRVFDEAIDLMQRRKPGRTALAASGGGITGLYFEMGALKCLDDLFSENLSDMFDMFFGISAGAIATSVIASGYSADELMASTAGIEGGRIPTVDYSLMKMGHLNLPDIKNRFKAAATAGVHALRDTVLQRGAPSIDELFLDYTAIVGPPFRSDHFEEILRSLFTREGTTNDFRKLSRSLFIGASDQDSRCHVLFGSEGWDDIPISQAVQASFSIHPAFSAVRINGRYYEDGAVTRTSDFVEAIHRGADLVFVLDPFVPYVSPEAGATNKRGILYNIDQDIRSLSYTRFENTRNWILRKHPEVSSYTFLPANKLRKLLSVNPMDHRPYLEIWRGAYLSTFHRVSRLAHRMRGDLVHHGIYLELERAAAISERLERTTTLKFEDFFVDGRVEIRTPKFSI